MSLCELSEFFALVDCLIFHKYFKVDGYVVSILSLFQLEGLTMGLVLCLFFM